MLGLLSSEPLNQAFHHTEGALDLGFIVVVAIEAPIPAQLAAIRAEIDLGSLGKALETPRLKAYRSILLFSGRVLCLARGQTRKHFTLIHKASLS